MIYSTSFSQPSSDKHGDEEGITSVVGGSSKQLICLESVIALEDADADLCLSK